MIEEEDVSEKRRKLYSPDVEVVRELDSFFQFI